MTQTSTQNTVQFDSLHIAHNSQNDDFVGFVLVKNDVAVGAPVALVVDSKTRMLSAVFNDNSVQPIHGMTNKEMDAVYQQSIKAAHKGASMTIGVFNTAAFNDLRDKYLPNLDNDSFHEFEKDMLKMPVVKFTLNK